jgi:hypothetical protein
MHQLQNCKNKHVVLSLGSYRRKKSKLVHANGKKGSYAKVKVLNEMPYKVDCS